MRAWPAAAHAAAKPAMPTCCSCLLHEGLRCAHRGCCRVVYDAMRLWLQVLGGDHARLRGWVSELRSERQRLEDQLLQDDVHGSRAQAMRNDLDKQVRCMQDGGMLG